MKSILFFLFIVAMLATGALWLRGRARRLAEENAARTHERALLLGITPALAQGAQSDGAAIPAVAANTAAARPPVTAATAAPAPNPVVAAQSRTAATSADRAGQHADASAVAGPPSSRRLRKMRRSRFGRVGLAYFEIMGFRVRRYADRQTPDAPIDALLFIGESAVPAMAVRWSRSEGDRATLGELRAFVDASTALRIARSTFIAQHGLEDAAADYADTRGIVCLDADTLALRLAEVDPIHHARLHEIVHGSK